MQTSLVRFKPVMFGNMQSASLQPQLQRVWNQLMEQNAAGNDDGVDCTNWKIKHHEWGGQGSYSYITWADKDGNDSGSIVHGEPKYLVFKCVDSALDPVFDHIPVLGVLVDPTTGNTYQREYPDTGEPFLKPINTPDVQTFVRDALSAANRS